MMDRRELVSLLGAAGLAGLACRPDGSGDNPSLQRAQSGPPYQFKALDAEQAATVAVLVDCIIPATETPGAAAAGVPEFIDVIVGEWYHPDERAQFLAGLAELTGGAPRSVRAGSSNWVATSRWRSSRRSRPNRSPPERPTPRPRRRSGSGSSRSRSTGITTPRWARSRNSTGRPSRGASTAAAPCLPPVGGALMPKAYDAIVVGSGITGGWAAKELSERGAQDAGARGGRPDRPGKDYVEHVPAWEMRFRGPATAEAGARANRCRGTATPATSGAASSSSTTTRIPTPPIRTSRSSGFRGRQVGGRSIMWGRQTYRWSDLDFEANLPGGHRHRLADPVRRHCPVVRLCRGVHRRERRAPGTVPAARWPVSAADGVQLRRADVRDKLPTEFGGERLLTIGRAAILTRNHKGRTACHYCGPCERGCITRSYFSSLNSTLPAARATGRLTLRPHSVVHSLIYDPRQGRVTGVRVIDGQTMAAIEFQARIVFLCASALESARNSAQLDQPGVPDRPGQLQRRAGAQPDGPRHGRRRQGTIPGNEGPDLRATAPTASTCHDSATCAKRTPVSSADTAFRAGRPQRGAGAAHAGFGPEFKHSLARPGALALRFYGFGECLPNHENFVELDPVVKDNWGIPALRIHCTLAGERAGPAQGHVGHRGGDAGGGRRDGHHARTSRTTRPA